MRHRGLYISSSLNDMSTTCSVLLQNNKTLCATTPCRFLLPVSSLAQTGSAKHSPSPLKTTVKYTTPLQRSFSIYVYNEKRYVGGLYTSLFCVIIPTLFLYFLPFWYPYILLHFKCFLSLVYVIFLAAGACILNSGIYTASNG